MGEETCYSKYMAKGSAITFTAQIIMALGGLGLRMFLTRAVSVGNYGLFFSVFALFSFVQNFRGLGLQRALTKHIPEFWAKEEFDELKSSSLITFIVQLAFSSSLALILIIFSEPLAMEFFGTKAAEPIIAIMSIWFVILSVDRVGTSIFQGLKDMTGFNSLKILRILPVILILLPVSFFTNIDIYLVAWAYVLSSVMGAVFALLRLRSHRSTFEKGKISFDKKLTKKLLLFGLPLIVSGFATTIMGKLDTLAITWFRSPEEVGLYQVARPVTRFIGYFGAITTPLLPMVSELWAEKNKKILKYTFRFLMKFGLLLGVPAALIFISFPKIVIRILFRPEYVGGALAMQILTIGMLGKVLASITGTGLIGIGESGLYARIMGAGAILNIAGNILLVPIWGIEGAAISTAGTFLFFLILRTYYLNKHVEFPSPLLEMGKTVLGAVLSLMLIYGLKSFLPLSLWPKIGVITALTGIFYIAWIFGTKIIIREDLVLLNRAIPIIPDKIKKLMGKIVRE